MLIVTVDRAGLDRGTDKPIRIEDTRTGRTKQMGGRVELLGRVFVVHGEERLDGATVWIECDGYA